MEKTISANSAVFSKIAEQIANTTGVSVEKITPESKFGDLGLDSLDALAMMSDLEAEFNIKIPNQELLKIRTVGQTVESIQKRLA